MRRKGILFAVILIIAYSNLALASVSASASAGLQEDFDRAADLESYKGKVRDIDTLEYIRNLTAIIQRENIQILNELKEIKKQLIELENKIGK